MNGIGCSLMDLAAVIMADFLHRGLRDIGITCCPKSSGSIQELQVHLGEFQVAVIGSGVAGATTSDSLSLLIGEALGYPVLSVKRELPFRDVAVAALPDADDHTCRVTVAGAERAVHGSGLIERAGWHPSLDVWSLRLLRRPSVRLFFTSVGSLLDAAERGGLASVMKVTA